MARSIRGPLLVWFAAILVAGLSLFGAALHYVHGRVTLSRVDEALEGRARMIAGAIENDAEDGWEIELSDESLAFAGHGFYFAAFAPDGRLLRESRGARASGPATTGFRTQENRREFVARSADGAVVVVGLDLDGLHTERRELLLAIIIAGTFVLALGLFGGWWMAVRTLAPIADLTATASRISPADLSTRLDLGRTPRELVPLATTLNHVLDRLRAAFERQQRFTADASHELRTPLAVVQTEAELALKRERRSPQEYREALGTILRAAERMGTLVQSLLQLAQGDAGAAGAVPQDIDLAALVRACVDEIAPLAQKAEVNVHIVSEAVSTRADPSHLTTVFTNLVRNAIQHSPPGGRVLVRVSTTPDREARVTVTDSGVGIAPDDLPCIFDRFYRADPARTRARGGAGLGLSIAQQVVVAHGGRIEAENAHAGGALFTVTLPGG